MRAMLLLLAAGLTVPAIQPALAGDRDGHGKHWKDREDRRDAYAYPAAVAGVNCDQLVPEGQGLGITRKNLLGDAWVFGALLGLN